MVQQNVQITSAFIANALRQCGYTTYTAICDIIDNSVEKDVHSSVVQIMHEGSASYITSLSIIDDGCGMDFNTLMTAMSLGAVTGKNTETLGYYGVGLKTAALAIGKKLEVWSRMKGSNKVNYAVIDLDDYYIRGKEIKVTFDEIEDQMFQEHGTIVKISKLDRISTRIWKNLKDTLKQTIGLTYNKFIFNDLCTFKIGATKVEAVDAVGDNSGIMVERMSTDGAHFKVGNIDIKYNAWYIPPTAIPNGHNWLPRSNNNCGIYIYRNDRLVGSGLSLGVLNNGGGGQAKTLFLNGLRIEMFMDGNADVLTGSSYLKTITDKDKDSLNDKFAASMLKEFAPFVAEAKARDKKIKEMEILPQDKQHLDDIANALNANIHINIPKEKNENEKPKEKQKKITSIKDILKDKTDDKSKNIRKFFKFDIVHLGETGPMVEYTDGIVINADHKFYQDVYRNLNMTARISFEMFFASEFATRKEMKIENSENAKELFDTHDNMTSSRMAEIVEVLSPDMQNVEESIA